MGHPVDHPALEPDAEVARMAPGVQAELLNANIVSVRRLMLIASLQWLLASCVTASAASPPATLVPAPLPCPSVPALANDLPTAFAYDLERAPSVMRLLTALGSVAPRTQKRMFNAVVAADSTPAEDDVERFAATVCPTLDAIYGTSRVLYLVSNLWKIGEVGDAKKFAAFSHVVALTVSALVQGDRLPPEMYRLAVAPFGDLPFAVAPTGPSPAPLASGACSKPDAEARPTHLVSPDYPPFAYASVTSGVVMVAIGLSDTGDVRYARAVSNTLQRGDGADAVIRASIFAVAASTYAPARKNCRGVPGVFALAAEFRRR